MSIYKRCPRKKKSPATEVAGLSCEYWVAEIYAPVVGFVTNRRRSPTVSMTTRIFVMRVFCSLGYVASCLMIRH